MSQAQPKVNTRHLATPINDEHRHTLPTSQSDNEDGGQPQQEVKGVVAAALMTGKVGDTHLSSNGHSDDAFNNNPESDEDDGKASPAKRKRPYSSHDGPAQKKRKDYLQ